MENQVTTVQLLVVSGYSEVLRVVWTVAESNLWQLIIASSAWDAMEKLRSDLAVDVLLIDAPPGDSDSLRCLRWLRHLRPALPILLIDRAQHASSKLHSVRIESSDYLVAPLSPPQLEIGIQRGLIPSRTDSGMDFAWHHSEPLGYAWLFVGTCPKMCRVSAQVALLAETSLPVFISGEPGCGKEMTARLLHQLSDRSGSPFAKVDCAALSPELLKIEIFGYEPIHGASEGNGLGKLELSGRGMLFLNEIAEMPLQLQLQLAHVMESRHLVRPGSSDVVEIDVRVAAASSLSVDAARSENRIVPELFRLFGPREIRIPPLRERKEELPHLMRHLVHQLSTQFGLRPMEFSAAMEKAWQLYQWPGNLRELKQAVKRYLIAGETPMGIARPVQDQRGDSASDVLVSCPSGNASRAPSSQPVTDIASYKSLRSMLRSVKEEAESAAIAATLEKTGWNRKAAARLLKISYRSILYKIEQYQINIPEANLRRRRGYPSKEIEGCAVLVSDGHKSASDRHPEVAEVDLVQSAGRSA